MWDIPVFTDHKYKHTDLIQYCMIKTEKTCILTDVAITDHSNVNTQETEELSKYKDLEVKVNRMWKVRTKIVQVIV
jgi:hypothetical protein